MISSDLNTAILIVIYGFIVITIMSLLALGIFFVDLWKKYKKPKDIIDLISCKKSKRSKLKCSILLTMLLIALSVFLGNLGHSEYQSQMKKRKVTYQVKHLDDTITTTDIEYV